MVSSEELECGCCYELLLNPTTLTCGHSFCRFCLAKWFDTSKKTECPECRQTWTGFPQVNVKLRSIIEKTFPDQVKSRVRTQRHSGDYDKVLEEFEKLGSKKSLSENDILSPDQIKTLIFWFILLVAAIFIVVVLGIVYWAFFTESKPSQVIYSKSANKWSVKEVVSWVQAFGGQLGHDYSDRFEKARINGELLLSLKEEDLTGSPLNISTALHRKIFLAEIMKLDVTGVKVPNDIWEYKNAHRTYSIFLVFMLQDFPRLTILFHRLEYDAALAPFMRAVSTTSKCNQTNLDDNEDLTCSKNELTSTDKFWFYVKVMLFPYYLISQFSWQYIDAQFFTVWIIISHCIMLTFRELLQLTKVNISFEVLCKAAIDATVSFCVTCVLYKVAVIFIPDFVLDFVFISKLYYGPIDTASSIKNGHLRTNALGKLFGVIRAGVDKILSFFR